MSNKSKFIIKYTITSFILCILGLYYTYESIRNFSNDNMIYGFIFILPSFVFYILASQSIVYYWHILDWIDSLQSEDNYISSYLNHFIYMEEEDNGIYLMIIFFNVPFSINGNKIVNKIIKHITSSNAVYDVDGIEFEFILEEEEEEHE